MAFNEHGITKDLIDAVRAVMNGQKIEEKKMDKVSKAELKGTHADRKDKDIDNDGDTDSSDEYLHKRRKAITKAVDEEGIAELSKKTLGNYIKKASQSASDNSADAVHSYHQDTDQGDSDAEKQANKADKRIKGIGTAVKKITKEEVELDEKLETDGPNKPSLDKMFKKVPTTPASRAYSDKKAGQRSDMNKKNDPGAAKKGLALSVVDREKAKKKAKEQGVGEAVDMDTDNAQKAVKHDCATHVVHKEHGEGRCIPGMHTLEENGDGTGYVTHYDVMFQGESGPYIVEDCPVQDLGIVKEMSHGHKKKK